MQHQMFNSFRKDVIKRAMYVTRVFMPADGNHTSNSIAIQIVTGIEVNSESYLPQLREYCPSAEGTWAIFPQLREIRFTIDR